MVTTCEAMVVQVLPLRRCKKTVPVMGVPLAVSVPVIEKDLLTGAEEGAEIVRAVGGSGVGVGVGVGVAVGVGVGVAVGVDWTVTLTVGLVALA